LAARLLFTNAGNAPSNNLARSLRTGTEPIFIVGCNDDQFTLKKSDVITAYGDNETKRKAMEGGAEGLLIKPIDFASLLEEIDTRLERKGHVRSARVFQTSTCLLPGIIYFDAEISWHEGEWTQLRHWLRRRVFAFVALGLSQLRGGPK
jgi:hypothetical protein